MAVINSLCKKLVCLLKPIKIYWAITKTLAYQITEFIMIVKKFMIQAPGMKYPIIPVLKFV